MTDSLPRRIHSRAKWHSYNEGLFFITCCTYLHRHYFGEIEDKRMVLSKCGKILDSDLRTVSERNPNIIVHSFTVMPNHIHLIVELKGGASDYYEEVGRMFGGKQSCLSSFIGSLKSGVSRKSQFMPKPLWQNGFHDRVIRTFEEYETISNYIDNNVANWREDRLLK